MYMSNVWLEALVVNCCKKLLMYSIVINTYSMTYDDRYTMTCYILLAVIWLVNPLSTSNPSNWANHTQHPKPCSHPLTRLTSVKVHSCFRLPLPPLDTITITLQSVCAHAGVRWGTGPRIFTPHSNWLRAGRHRQSVCSPLLYNTDTIMRYGACDYITHTRTGIPTLTSRYCTPALDFFTICQDQIRHHKSVTFSVIGSNCVALACRTTM